MITVVEFQVRLALQASPGYHLKQVRPHQQISAGIMAATCREIRIST
jgi:hypothetical protein